MAEGGIDQLSIESSDSESGNYEMSGETAGTCLDTLHSATPSCESGATASDAGMADPLDKLLQKNRQELLFELRKIEHGDRPVTGQGNKEALEQFFEEQMDTTGTSQSSEQHRPEAVVVEVQGLFEQRRVSNILQTNNFRRHLENIIRGSISVASNNQRPQRSQRVTRSSNVNVSQSRQSSISSTTTSQVSVPPPPPPPVPTTPTEGDERSQNPLLERFQEDLHGSQSSISSHSTPEPAEGRGRVPDENRVPQINLDTVNQLQREDIVQEISELVHQHLVSSTLDSEFRGHLEMHIQNRIPTTGADGQRVQEFVRSLNPTQHIQRNDFSNLGLPVHPEGDNWENISVTSVNAQVVPYTQTNMHLAREIQALKAQIDKMSNMMKLSFELQMDIQRSIRQEVAAAINTTPGEALAATNDASKPVDDTHCLICLEAHSDSVLYQCGHMCVCYACGKHLLTHGAKCPVCRAPIKDIIRAYKCNSD